MSGYDVSVVIPTLNGLALCEDCIASIRRNSGDLSIQVVLVDNGSDDATVERFRDEPDVLVLAHDRNQGYGRACNNGISAATGRDIVLLNNDTIVTPGWLEGLRAAAHLPGVGVAGPVTNRAAGIQELAEVGYRDLAGLDAYAAQLLERHGSETIAVPRLIGFCIYLRRAVIERIGGFDVGFGIGNFEDDDLVLRAGIAGFGAVVVPGVFVHHHGSVTFLKERIDHARSMSVNFSRFAAKWRLSAPPGAVGYDAQEALCMTFDPVLHHEPLAETIEPLAVADELRPHVVAVVADGRTQLAALLSESAAGLAGRDATLLVALDGGADLLDRLTDAAAGSDLDIVALDGDPDLARLAARADVTLETGSARFRAACARVGMHPVALAADAIRAA